MLGLSWPSVADFCASSKSVALAAKMSLRAAARASWTASKAAFLAEVGRVASFLDESFAARAASSAEALVRDMICVLHVIVVECLVSCRVSSGCVFNLPSSQLDLQSSRVTEASTVAFQSQAKPPPNHLSCNSHLSKSAASPATDYAANPCNRLGTYTTPNTRLVSCPSVPIPSTHRTSFDVRVADQTHVGGWLPLSLFLLPSRHTQLSLSCAHPLPALQHTIHTTIPYSSSSSV